MPRIAAVADLHCHDNMRGQIAEAFRDVNEAADVLVLAGDITATGRPSEAREMIKELKGVDIPIVAVLGNHDFHQDEQETILDLLMARGIHVLDGTAVELTLAGIRVGFAGTKGFGGGYGIYLLSPFGEQVVKDFVRERLVEVEKLERALAQLHAERRVVVVHYSPVRETLKGEPLDIYPFMGNSELSLPIDRFGADAVFHGHSHYGSIYGHTDGGIPVFNVAQTLVSTYHLFHMVEKHGAPGAAVSTEDQE